MKVNCTYIFLGCDNSVSCGVIRRPQGESCPHPCSHVPCQSNDVVMSPNSSDHNQSLARSNQHARFNDSKLKTIFVITPTHQRKTQKIDLTAMCHTLMLVPEVVWIVIEDAPKPTSLVTQLLSRCKVETVHLTVSTSPAFKPKNGASAKSASRGVEQRNAGLSWLRQHYETANCNGAVFFGDDDNKYDLRLFDDVSPHLYVVILCHSCSHLQWKSKDTLNKGHRCIGDTF